jgi:hypothetical protein
MDLARSLIPGWLRIVCAAALLSLASTAVEAQIAAPSGCAVPNALPWITKVAQPTIPPLAQQREIFGIVSVIVTLDDKGKLLHAEVDSSPHILLNRESVGTAGAMQFAPQIVDCKPVGGSYLTLFQFGEMPAPSQPTKPAFSAYFRGVWQCQAESRPPVMRLYVQRLASKDNSDGDFFVMHAVRQLSPGFSAADAVDEEHYVRYRDRTERARLTDPTGFPFDGTAAIIGDKLTFEAKSTAPRPVLRRLTYARMDAEHYTRVFESELIADGPWTTLSSEQCVRAAALE